MDSYILYYRKNGSSWKEAARNIKDASYTHTKLTLGDQYTYTVRGVVGNQKTDYNKNGVSAYVVPAAVKLGKVTSAGYDRVKLTWTKMMVQQDTLFILNKMANGRNLPQQPTPPTSTLIQRNSRS